MLAFLIFAPFVIFRTHRVQKFPEYCVHSTAPTESAFCKNGFHKNTECALYLPGRLILDVESRGHSTPFRSPIQIFSERQISPTLISRSRLARIWPFSAWSTRRCCGRSGSWNGHASLTFQQL